MSSFLGAFDLNKISVDWPLTLTTQPSTSNLSDNPDDVTINLLVF